MTYLKLGDRTVSLSETPFVIAEAGSNFNQDIDIAFRLIDAAAKADADCVKFQLFNAEKLYPKNHKLFPLFKSIELNADWLLPLKEHAESNGILFAASAFDHQSIDRLCQLGVPFHKIASSEIVNLKLLNHFAKCDVPSLISTGMSDFGDIETAVALFQKHGNNAFALMQCKAMYPLENEEADTLVIRELFSRYGCVVGFSDHTLECHAAAAAVALGARVIEKHFTLSRDMDGPDHKFALTPDELADYINVCRRVFVSLGSSSKQLTTSEKENGRREGLYFANAYKAGHLLTQEDVLIQQPALELRSTYRELVVGSKLIRDVKAKEPISIEDITH